MARKRHVLPEYQLDPEFNSIPIGSRYLYGALLTHMDYRGVTLGNPTVIKSKAFATDPKTSVATVRKWVDALVKIDRLRRFTHNGVEYLFAPHFHGEQKIYSDELVTYTVPAEVIPGLDPSYSKGRTRAKLPFSSASTSTSTSTLTRGTADAEGVADAYGRKAAEAAALVDTGGKPRTFQEVLARARALGGISGLDSEVKLTDTVMLPDGSVYCPPSQVVDNLDENIIDATTGAPIGGYRTSDKK